ncbi:MAG: hypothetical protein CM1200mP41_35230 [Gammaproteobacteria bacterium]|nr:MAG: hypothetical protein CM1200mP41_35230 [Gammaproteobacteria bacterium]
MSAGTFVSYIGSVLMLMGPVKRLARVNEFIQSGSPRRTVLLGAR